SRRAYPLLAPRKAVRQEQLKRSPTVKTRLAAAIMAFLLGIPSLSLAGNPWYVPYHPRVSEVNTRVGWQAGRIRQGVRSGSISSTQAYALRQQRYGIKTEERGMRAADGGHLTAGDYRLLNSQLNYRSREIYSLKH